jgi:3-oxoacyl-[acyl-carrier-protein] synthase II
MATNKEAVWITGVGAATSLGVGYSANADALLEGRCGIGPVTGFDVSSHPCRIAARLGDVPVPGDWDAADFRRRDLLDQLAIWCAAEALHDAGWWDRRGDLRIGLVLGVAAEWLRAYELDGCSGGDRAHAPRPDDRTAVGRVRQAMGLTGPAATTAAACASGNYALAMARRWLRLGWADVCVAGGCSLEATPMNLASFGNLGALSRRNDDPRAASRPFDRGRDGLVMGEGGAMFVLETESRARRRGARAYAELVGFGASSDAYHMVMPNPDPGPAAQAMRAALADAGVAADGVDYLNAHATSTPAGDRCEARAVHAALGAATSRTPISSTKGATGHLLSAAAAVEAMACLVALDRQTLPPTLNLDDPDPECDLCHVPHTARPARVRVAASNSFGFGGSNTCLVLRKAA